MKAARLDEARLMDAQQGQRVEELDTEITRIVADEKQNCQQLPPGTNRPRPFCSERAQKARFSITNYTRHPVRTAARPALSSRSLY